MPPGAAAIAGGVAGASTALGAAAEASEAEGGSAALASASGARGGGAAQPVSPEDAGGAPPTISTVATNAHG